MTIKATSLTPEVLLSSPRRSPGIPNSEGNLVLYTVSTYDFAEHKKTEELRLLDAKTNACVLLDDSGKLSSPVWFDGDIIAVLRTGEDDVTEVVVGNVHDFKNSYVAGTVDGPASNLKITHLGGKHFGLAVSAPAYPDGSIFNPSKQPKRHSTGRLYKSLFVRHWDTYIGVEHQSIWYGALETKNVAEKDARYYLTPLVNALKNTGLESPIPPDGGQDHFDISKSGLVFVAKDPKLNPALNTKCNIYLVPLSNFMETTPTLFTVDLNPFQGAMSSPVFSRDGKQVAFLLMRQNGYESDKNQLFVIPDVTRPAWVVHFFASENNKGSWDRSPSSVAFSPDAKIIYLTAADRGCHRLFSLPNNPFAAAAPIPLSSGGSISSIVPLTNNTVFLSSTSLVDSSYYEILAIHAGKPHVSQISSISHNGSAFGLSRSQISEIHFEGGAFKRKTTTESGSSESSKVQAWVLQPPNFSSDKKYPVAFLIHGGPQYVWGDEWTTRDNPFILAAQGYVVIMPNITGSIGFGQDFTDAIENEWGGLPYEDFVACFDHVKTHLSYADTDRAVALGASYGGFMMNWIQGKPFGRSFRALVTHNGVFSTPGLLATEELYFPNREFGGPWGPSTRDRWLRWDPSRFTHEWNTPHLIIHTDKDFRLDMSQGLAPFNMLQSKGIESEFLNFPDENHFVLDPENALVWWKVMLGWINKHVGIDGLDEEGVLTIPAPEAHLEDRVTVLKAEIS